MFYTFAIYSGLVALDTFSGFSLFYGALALGENQSEICQPCFCTMQVKKLTMSCMKQIFVNHAPVSVC
jgi:hypothetical protein